MVVNKKTARPGEKARFEKEKILVARMGKEIIATYDKGGMYVKDAMMLVNKGKSNLLFLLAILNSKLITYYYKVFFVTIDVLKNALLSIPIPENFDIRYNDQLVNLVTQMLEAKKQLQQVKTEGDKTFLENKCSNLDKQIDKLVYQLYGLTEEEIKIVEGK